MVAHRPATGVHRRFFRPDGSEICFLKGDGGCVFDTGMNRYYDFILGFGAVSIGHANDEFNRRLRDGLSAGLLLPGYAELHREYCFRLLQGHSNLHVVCLFKTGSEALTAALRISTARTHRKGVVRSGYIGWHDALLADTPAWHEPPGSTLASTLRYSSNMRGVGVTEPALNWIDFNLTTLEKLLTDCDNDIGTFIFDVYQLTRTNADILQGAVELCRASCVTIVFDETKTAGRLSRVGVLTGKEPIPDFVVVGKAISNGAPLSVLLSTEFPDSVCQELPELRVGGTYSGDLFGPLSGLITMQIMDEFEGYSRLQEVGQRVCTLLNGTAESVGVADALLAVPLFDNAVIDLHYSPKLVNDLPRRLALERAFHENGVLLLDGHPNYVCLDHYNIDWDHLASAFRRALCDWANIR